MVARRPMAEERLRLRLAPVPGPSMWVICLALPAALLCIFGESGPARAEPRLLPPRGSRAASVTLPSSASEECTIAVLSGRATADGRPLLWKNRDATNVDNEVVYFEDDPPILSPRYLGLVNAGDKAKVWMGVNDAGFAVLNSVSFNIADSCSWGIGNGELMKEALQTCSSVEDFQALLVRTNATGRNTPTNLAVIDAQGGAALFEAGSFHFVEYDAADSVSCPAGYVVRANLSLSYPCGGYDAWRYTRALALVSAVVSAGGADVSDLLRTARDLVSPSLDPYPLPYRGAPPAYPALRGYVEARQTINRRTTVAAGVIQGVRPGEDPRLSTFFAMVGEPVLTPVVPLWVCAGPTPPAVDGPATAALCDAAKSRTLESYDFQDNYQLLNTQLLVELPTLEPGYLATVESIEGLVLPELKSQMILWRATGVVPAEVASVEARYAEFILARYQGEVPAEVGPGGDLTLLCTPNPVLSRGAWLSLQSAGGHPLEGPPAQWGIDVFDLQGRLWARLQAQESDAAAAGPGQSPGVWWDGRVRGGGPVPSGVYFCRPTWPPHLRATRLIVIH